MSFHEAWMLFSVAWGVFMVGSGLASELRLRRMRQQGLPWRETPRMTRAQVAALALWVAATVADVLVHVM